MAERSAIIFDLDGVVINSEPLHDEAKRTIFRDYGLEVPERVHTEFRGKTDREVMEHVASTFAPDGLDADELVAAKQRVFRELMNEMELVPGVRSFIAQVREHGLRLALTTSALRENQELTFEKFHLDEFFEAITTAEDVTRPKPDPEPYLITVEKLDEEPGRCLVIEDSVNGVLSAKNAGCEAAGLSTTFAAEELREAGADVVVDDFDELAAHLGWH